jgi:hypothetical protein
MTRQNDISKNDAPQNVTEHNELIRMALSRVTPIILTLNRMIQSSIGFIRMTLTPQINCIHQNDSQLNDIEQNCTQHLDQSFSVIYHI